MLVGSSGKEENKVSSLVTILVAEWVKFIGRQQCDATCCLAMDITGSVVRVV